MLERSERTEFCDSGILIVWEQEASDSTTSASIVSFRTVSQVRPYSSQLKACAWYNVIRGLTGIDDSLSQFRSNLRVSPGEYSRDSSVPERVILPYEGIVSDFSIDLPTPIYQFCREKMVTN